MAREELIGYGTNLFLKKLKEILLGKSGQQFEDGIPPNEIREEIVNDLFKEAEEKLPPQLVELVKITKQPLIQPIFDLQSIKMKNGRVVTIGDAALLQDLMLEWVLLKLPWMLLRCLNI